MRYGEHLMSSNNHLPVSLAQETWDHGLPFVDIRNLDLTVEQLGQEIVTNNDAGSAASKEAQNRWVDAGRLLIEAKSRVPNFEEFLRVHCNGLSRSWAYDLMKMARGEMREVLAKARARRLKHHEKRKANGPRVRSGTDTNSSSQLAQEILLAQFQNEFEIWLEQLDDETLKHAVSYVLRRSNDRNPALAGH
jgi:hypothetical protein